MTLQRQVEWQPDREVQAFDLLAWRSGLSQHLVCKTITATSQGHLNSALEVTQAVPACAKPQTHLQVEQA